MDKEQERENKEAEEKLAMRNRALAKIKCNCFYKFYR